MSDPLTQFLNKPANSHAREAILMHKLFLDTKVAAATSGYYLNTYFDDVDHDGFDVIFDDQDTLIKVQVKTVERGASTRSWNIHKRILRPQPHMTERLGFPASADGDGSQGGVIVIEFNEEHGTLAANYYYTDLFILRAFEIGVLQRTHAASRAAVTACVHAWQHPDEKVVVKVPRAAFLRARNPSSLLALMGLHSDDDHNWKHLMCIAINQELGDRSLKPPATLSVIRDAAHNDLKKLTIGEHIGTSPLVVGDI